MEVVRGKMGVGNWHGLRQLAAELVFSNLSEALLAARGYSPRNPDAFLGSVPA